MTKFNTDFDKVKIYDYKKITITMDYLKKLCTQYNWATPAEFIKFINKHPIVQKELEFKILITDTPLWKIKEFIIELQENYSYMLTKIFPYISHRNYKLLAWEQLILSKRFYYAEIERKNTISKRSKR